jgi:O-antigen/teichoic acid export membrane protein
MEDSLGKGTVFIICSDVVAALSGYGIHVAVSRYFSPELYGIFGIILSLAVNINLTFLAGIPVTVSKYVAENVTFAYSIKKQASKLQGLFALGIFVFYLVFADTIGNLLHDPNLGRYLRLAAFIVPVSGISLIFDGLLKGLRRFKIRSIVVALYHLTKVITVTVLVFMGFSIKSVIFGLIFTETGRLFIGWNLCRFQPHSYTFQMSRIVKFAIPCMLYFTALFLLGNIDLLLVKHLIMDGAMTGYYVSARVLSQSLALITSALAIALLPTISRSYTSGNIQLTKTYIAQSLRYLLLVLTPLAAFINAAAVNLIQLVFPVSFSEAGKALSILVISRWLVSIFLILINVITGTGHPVIAMMFAFLMVGMSFFSGLLLIPAYQLAGAAISICLTTLTGSLAASTYVYFKFRTLMSLPSFIKIMIASLVVYSLAAKYPASGIFLVIQGLMLLVLYLLILFLIGEIGEPDFQLMKRVATSLF